MDYTLSQYKPETFEKLAHDLTVEKLVSVFGYPEVTTILLCTHLHTSCLPPLNQSTDYWTECQVVDRKGTPAMVHIQLQSCESPAAAVQLAAEKCVATSHSHKHLHL